MKVYGEARLTKDAEVQQVNDSHVTKMRIVHNKWSKTHGEQPQFFSLKIWKDMPLKKGQSIMIEGELEEYSYDKNGEKRSMVYIKAYKVVPIRFEKVHSTTETVQKVFGQPSAGGPDDGIPFMYNWC